MKPTNFDEATAGVRERLGDVQQLLGQTHTVERKLLDVTHTRLNEVNQQLDQLADRTLTDDQAAETYQHLIVERGRLQQIIQRTHAGLTL